MLQKPKYSDVDCQDKQKKDKAARTTAQLKEPIAKETSILAEQQHDIETCMNKGNITIPAEGLVESSDDSMVSISTPTRATAKDTKELQQLLKTTVANREAMRKQADENAKEEIK